MKDLLLPKSGPVASRLLVVLLASLLWLAACPAVAQTVTTNVPSHLGTFSVGTIHWSLDGEGGTGPCSWSVVAGSLPPGVRLRSQPLQYSPSWAEANLLGVATDHGEYPFTLRATCGTESADVATALRITHLLITDGPWDLPEARVGQPYSYAFHSSGSATGDAVWSPQGSLPDGLTLTEDGVLSGTPTTAGTAPVTVAVSDGVDSVTRGFSLLIVDGPRITNPLLPNAQQGVAYSAQIPAVDLPPGYTFSIVGGSLPPGLTMDSGGLVTGTPLVGPGRFPFTVNEGSYNRNLCLYVIDAPARLPAFQPHGGIFDDCTLGSSCRIGFFAYNGGTPPFTWTASGLPPGLRLTDSAVLSQGITPGDAEINGVPAELGVFPVEVTVTDVNGQATTKRFQLTVSPLVLWQSGTWGVEGAPYLASLHVIGGDEPYAAPIVTGVLPAGVNYDPATLVAQGTPTETGGFHVDFRATANAVSSLAVSVHFQVDGPPGSTIAVGHGRDLGTVPPGSPYGNQLWACCAAAGLTWSVVQGTLPPGLSLSTGGLLSGTTGGEGIYTFTVEAAETGNPANAGRRQLTLTVSPLQITGDSNLPFAHAGTPVSITLEQTGAVGEVTWSLSPYSVLPPGLTLTPTGLLSGTPTSSGQHDFELVATDTAGHKATRWYNVSIYPAGVTPPVWIATQADLGTWSVGQVQATFWAQGGDGTYSWTLVDGELPPGTSLRPASALPSWIGGPGTAAIVGVVTEAGGPYSFTLRVSSGTEHWDRTFTVKVTALHSTDRGWLPEARLGQLWSHTVTAGGGVGELTWAADGPLPEGLSLSTTGVLSGTLSSTGRHDFGLSVTDGVDTIHRWYSLFVNDGPTITNALLPNAEPGVPYSAQIPAIDLPPGYTFSRTGGNLPPGLSLDSAGLITGTPSSGPGRWDFSVNEGLRSRTLSLFVVETPALQPAQQPHGGLIDDCTIGSWCSIGFWVGYGGTPPFSWSAVGLPNGLSITSQATPENGMAPGDGEIFGYPTQLGTFPVDVTVTDSHGRQTTKRFTITVSPLAFWSDGTWGNEGEGFLARLFVVGGTAPHTAAIRSGYVPWALTFDPGALTVSGTAAETGGFHLDFSLADTAGALLNASTHIQVNGLPGSTVTVNMGRSLGSAMAGAWYQTQLWGCCAESGLTWSVSDGALPPGLVLSASGLLSGTATTEGVYSFTVHAADSANASNSAKRRLTLNVTPLWISSTETPPAFVGTPLSVSLGATGGVGAVTWTLAPSSALPLGVTLTPDGRLTGTPAASGQFDFTVTATDAAGHWNERSGSLAVYPEGTLPPVRISNGPNFGTWSIGEVSTSLDATGGDGIYEWSVVGGELPPGLSLRHPPDIPSWWDPEPRAAIVGIATQAGDYTFALRVVSGGDATEREFRVRVSPLHGVDDYRLAEGYLGQPYVYALTGAGNTGDISWSTGSELPPGLTMNSAGVISGTPTQAGTWHFGVGMEDDVDSTGRGFRLEVYDVRVTSPSHLPNATQGVPYSAQLTAAGGSGDYTFAVDGGLPWGLIFDPATGAISGTTTTGPGPYSFNVTATDSNHVSHVKRLSITVIGVPLTLPAIVPWVGRWDDCTFGVHCMQGVSISDGGVPPFTWTATGLPDGMSIVPGNSVPERWISPSDGAIVGVPTALGSFDVTVSVTDANGSSVSNTFPLRVSRLMQREFDGNARRDEPFSSRIRVIGGEPSVLPGAPGYAMTIVGGRLPLGLDFDAATQTISGTAVENGNFSVGLRVTDAADPVHELYTTLGLQVGSSTSTLRIDNDNLGSALIGASWNTYLWACCVPTPVTWDTEPSGTPLPAGLQLSPEGRLSGTIAGDPGTVTFLVRASDSLNPANYAIRRLTLWLTTMELSTNGELPWGNVGTAYSRTLSTTGGSGAITWSLEPGSYLPPGLTFSPEGILSGTPAATGRHWFTLRASDEAGSTIWRAFSVEFYPAGEAAPLALNIGTDYNPQVGMFSVQISADAIRGGVPPYTFSLTPEAELPPGASPMPGMRVLDGPPLPNNFGPASVAGFLGVIAAPGTYHPSIRVSDSAGQHFDRVLTITVPAHTILSNNQLPRAVVGIPYSVALQPHGGSANYSWSATELPPGLALDSSTGVLAGTPTAFGTYWPSVQLYDVAAASSVGRGFTLAVDPFSIDTAGLLPPATVGRPYSVTLSAPNCAAPCTWSRSSGALPWPFTIDPATGVISGIPKGRWSGSFTVRAQGNNGWTEKLFTLTVLDDAFPLLLVTTAASLPDVTVGQFVSWMLTAQGGTPPYSWSLESGTLPEGLSLVNHPELISSSPPGIARLMGRVLSLGPHEFTLRVVDGAGGTTTKTFTTNVTRLWLHGSMPTRDAELKYNQAFSQRLIAGGGSGLYTNWAAVNGMPPGLVLDSTTGMVSGTPTNTGSWWTVVRVTDSEGNAYAGGVTFNTSGPTATSLYLSSGPNLGVVTVGSQCSWNVTPSGTGTVLPYTLTALTPLPPGFALVSGGDGIPGGPTSPFNILGKPLAAGVYSFTLEGRDAADPPNVGVMTYTVTVAPFVTNTGGTLPVVSAGRAMTLPLMTFDGAGPVTWTVSPGSQLPPGLAIDGDAIIGTPTATGTFAFALDLSDASGAVTTRTFTLTVSPIVIDGGNVLPAIVTGVPYTHAFTGSGGTLTWSLSGNPSWLSISPTTGMLSGTRLSGSGNIYFTVTASDGTASLSRFVYLPSVQPNPGVLGIPLGSTRVTDLAVGQTPWYELSATDGVPPYAWSVAPGHSLPPGVQLVSGNGLGALGFYPGASALMGIATQAGDFTFDLVVTDQAGSQARRTFQFHVAPFTVLGNTNNTVIAGSPFTMRFVPVGVTPPSTFTLSPTGALQDVLPPGVSLSADGLLSGTPTSTGVYNSWMKVTDGANRTYTQYLRLIVNAAGASTPFRVTGQNPGSTWVGGYGYRSLATNRSGAALTWSAVGALPAGVRLVRSTSQTTYVSGTGVAPGSYTFTLRARDDGTGDMADHTFTWKVGNVQVVFPAWPITNVLDIPAAEQGQPYSFAFGLAGGTRPYTVTPSSFDPLPPGLALSTEGVLSGTPERSGSYTISLVVTDAGGIVTEIGGLTLIVTPPSTPPPLIRTGSIFLSASVGAPYAFALDGTLRGGTPPFTWELEPGSSLPPGLVLFPGGNGVSAHIGGTASVPNSPGSPYGFWLTVTDAGGQALTTYLTLNVSPLAITPDALPPGRVGTSYSQALLVSGGVGPYTISLNTVSDMPPGLSLSPTGLLSGTPSSPGIYGISLRVTDSVSNVLTKVLYVFVDNAAGDVPTVTMSPRRVQVYHEVGAPLPVAQPVTVGASSSAGVVSLALHAAPGVTLTSTGGTAPFTTHVGFDISTLPAGTYAGLLAVSGRGMANLGDAIPVSVVVAPAPPCTYRVEPVGGSVPNLGGSGTFEVKTGWTCGWTAVSSAPWLTVTAGATGTASGSVTYLAAVNPDPGVRTATITVAGAVYTVSQLGTECSFTIDPAETSATALGGQATVIINASSTACAWSSSAGPLTIVPANGTGSGTVTVTVPANGAPESRTLTATIAGRTFSVLQTGIDCTVALGAGGTTVPSGASAGSVEVTTPAGCPYSTVPGPNWISITSGGSGTGSGTLVYNVEANSTTYPRSGTLIVGGQPFQITQDPLPCSVTLNTTLLGSPYGTAAATGSIGVTANGANCSWTASSNVPWATVSPDSGTGNRTLTMSVQSNEAGTSSRAGEVLIAGQTVAISQAGTVCSYVLESTSGVASAIGGTASVRVIAPTPCSWSATSNASWLTITASGSSGTSAVQFTVAANPAAYARSGTLTIRGMTYTVEQAGASCSFAIVGPSTSPLLASAGATGQSFAFAASATGCSPSAVSYANWITIDGTSFIGTAGTVTYSVASNPYGVERRGTIQVGNALYTIVQAGAPCGYSLSIYGRLFHVEGGIDTLLASPTAAACTPTAGTDMPSFITLGPLTGPVLNLFSLPYEVAPFPSLTPTVRVGRITLGGQILTIKQLSW